MPKWNQYSARAFKPEGWLRRQLQIQAEGLCGNLDKVWPDIRDSAWIGGDREGWERVPYWLDGFIPLAYLLDDDDMICRAKRYIDAILAAQQPDGWICPCPEAQRSSYDTWAVLLISKVLTVYYDCSGDPRIPGVLYRVLKNYHSLLCDGSIRLYDWGKHRWFEGYIAIRFLYDCFPEEWLIDLARILKEQGANYPEFSHLWKRPLNLWRQETHIVNLAMMLKYEAISCDLLGMPYTDIAERLYSILHRYNGTPVGTFTGDECLSGLSPIQGTELCSVVELMYSLELLYAFTGDSKWAERLEVVAFNALPATLSDDMWTHQYVQMSNQIACKPFPGKSLFRTNGPEAHLFGLEPNFGCCTANFGQGWPKFALSAFMCSENTIQCVLPLPCRLDAPEAVIRLETDYPFDNSFQYSVQAKQDFTFCIRIPSFAKDLTVNGTVRPTSDLCFHLKAGESAVLDITFNTNAEYIPRPHGMHTVQRGSLVFSLPIRYEKQTREYEKDGVPRKYPYCDYEYTPLSAWNYAYCGSDLQTYFQTVSDIPFSSKTPPITIRTKLQKIDWGPEDGYEEVCAKTPHSTSPLSAAEEIELYPYGCAKLRMTELPLIEL